MIDAETRNVLCTSNKTKAILMVVLIISLPIYSSFVIAAESGTYTITVSGEDNVNGFMKAADKLKVILSNLYYEKDNVADTDIGPTQVRAIIPGSTNPVPLQCQPTGSNYFGCRYESQQKTWSFVSGNVLIKFYGDNGNQVPSRSFTVAGISSIRIDETAPTVTVTDVTQDHQGTTVSYTANDPGTSSGFDRIEVYVNGVLVDTATDVSTPILLENKDLRGPAVAAADSLVSVTVYDKLGQLGTDDMSKVLDLTKPRFVSNNLRILRNNNEVHKLIEGTDVTLTVEANISDTSGLFSVTGDFSDLINGGIVPATIVRVGSTEIYTATWQLNNVQVNPTKSRITVPLTITDNNGNKETVSPGYPLEADKSAPVIDTNTFSISLNKIGGSLPVQPLQPGMVVPALTAGSTTLTSPIAKTNYLPKNGGKITISLAITEENGISTASIDLSPIGYTNNNGVLSLSCGTPVGDTYTCTGTATIPPNPTPANSFTVTVEDDNGNSGTVTVNYQIKVDSKAPKIKYLGTLSQVHQAQNNSGTFGTPQNPEQVFFDSFVKTGNNRIVAQIEEEETTNFTLFKKDSYDNALILAITPAITPTPTFKKDCILLSDGKTHECSWEAVIPSGTHGTIYKLALSVTDIGGNTAAENKYVKLDTDPPIIKSLDVLSVGTQGNDLEFHQVNGQLIVKMVVEDDSPVAATVDFNTDIGGVTNAQGNTITAAECEPIPETINQSQCDVQAPALITNYRSDIALPITVIDSVGNSKNIEDDSLTADKVYGAKVDTTDKTITIDVLETDTTVTKADFWEVQEITPMPETLDRHTVEKIQQRQYFSLDLRPIRGDYDIMQIRLVGGSCVAGGGDGDSDTNIPDLSAIEKIGITNTKTRDKKHPWMYLILKQAKPDFDEIHVTCQLEIFSGRKSGGKVTKYIPVPQYLNVTLETKLYNMPLGDISEVLQDQVDKYRKRAFNDIQKTIGTLNKIVEYATKICKIMQTIHNLVELFGKIKLILGGVEVVTKTVDVTQQTTTLRINSCTLEETGKEGADKAYQYFDSYCKFVNCQAGDFLGISDYTKDFKKYYDTIGTGFGLTDYAVSKSPSDTLSPKNSLVSSIVFLCIPGIIYNLNKLRNIDCKMIECLEGTASELESQSDIQMPIRICKKQKAEAECKYLYGEIFQILPFVALFDYYMNELKTLMTNPVALGGQVLSKLCKAYCNPADVGGWGHFFCTFPIVVSRLGSIYSEVKGIVDMNKDDGWKVEDYCDKVKEEKFDNGKGKYSSEHEKR